MSAVAVEESPTTTLNPLDMIEEIVVANQWPFDRSNDDELIVEIAARWCDYRLYFVWQEDVERDAVLLSIRSEVSWPRAGPMSTSCWPTSIRGCGSAISTFVRTSTRRCSATRSCCAALRARAWSSWRIWWISR